MDKASGRQTLAERLARDFQDRLLQPQRPGGRVPSVRKLAAELGVSVPTVRAAQALLAARGLLEIRHGSGVYVTRPREPRWVGIYTEYDILQPRTSLFHLQVPHFLREFLLAQGVEAEVYIGYSHPEERQQAPSNARFRADAETGRLNGVIILNAPSTHGWGQWVRALQVPAVGNHTPYQVELGYQEMVAQSVRHLADQGCHRIAMLAWGKDGLRQALQEALGACGLAFHPEWVRTDLHPSLSGAGWEEFREIWCASPKKPDGLLVADDLLFDEARIAIQDLRIAVPQELRIVAHANKGAGRRYPFPVTEVRLDPERYAAALGTLLVKRLRGEAVARPLDELPFELAEGAVAGGAGRVGPLDRIDPIDRTDLIDQVGQVDSVDRVERIARPNLGLDDRLSVATKAASANNIVSSALLRRVGLSSSIRRGSRHARC